MSCQITIDEISGLIDPDNGDLNIISVRGTKVGCDDCGSLIVTLNDSLTATAVEHPDIPGGWVANFTSFGTNPPRCNDLVDVMVQCSDNSDHKAVDRKNLICKPGSPPTNPPSCPTYSISVTPTDDCNEEGRLVLLDFSFSGTPPQMWQWAYGDGAHSAVQSNLGQTQHSWRYDDSGGAFTGALSTVLPQGCGSTPFTVQVAPCPGNGDTPQCDPRIVTVEVVDLATSEDVTDIALSTDEDDCLPAGTYRIRVTSPSDPGQSYYWYQNGSSTPMNGQNGSELVQQISQGQQIDLLVGIQIGGCGYQSGPIRLKACEGSDIPEGGNDGTEPDPRREPEPPPTTNPRLPSPCQLWFWFNVILFLATAVVIFITGCMIEAEAISAIGALASGGTLSAVFAALSAATIAMMIVSVLLILFSLLSFFLWLIICAPNMAKGIVCSLLTILMSLLQLCLFFSALIAVILFLVGHIGCAIGGVIDVAWFGFLSSITWFAGMMICGWGSTGSNN